MEYIEPTPSSRRKLTALFVGAVAIGLIVLGFRDEFFARVLTLPPCQGVEIFRWLFVAMFIVLLGGIVLGVLAARKSLKLDQWPLPGTWVFRRTPIRRGREVKWRSYALMSLSVVAIALGARSWYLLEQFVDRVKQRHCPNQAAMQPNNSLERTGWHRGPRLAAAWSSWPAVQQDR